MKTYNRKTYIFKTIIKALEEEGLTLGFGRENLRPLVIFYCSEFFKLNINSFIVSIFIQRIWMEWFYFAVGGRDLCAANGCLKKC